MKTHRTSESNPRRPLIRRYAVNGAMILASCAFAVLVMEIALWLFGISSPRYEMYDEYTGDALRPSIEFLSRDEGEAFIRVNSQGLRDREHPLDKPPNAVRIAILGDSYAAAFQVPVEKTFWAVLEREMRNCPRVQNRTVEVINFGVPGYGTARELLMLRHRAWAYSPDIVLLAFLSGNDIGNNSPAIDPESFRKPYFIFKDGRLVLDDSFRESEFFRVRQTGSAKLFYQLYNASRVIQLFNRARFALSSMGTANAVAGLPGTEPGLNNEIYSEPSTPVWRDAWKVTEELIVQMRDEVAARGARFLVVTLSNGIQVHPDAQVRQNFAKSLGIQDLFYPDFRVEELGKQESIPMLILAPLLREHAERHQVYLHGFGPNLGFGHWNENGHKVAGERMAQELCSRITAH